MPVTAQNVTSLMHPGVTTPSRRDQVDAAINDLMNDAIVPFGEKDGNLCFFSEKLNEIDKERAQLPVRTIEIRRIKNEALKEVFTPLPSVNLHGSLSVMSGLKATVSGSMASSLSGEGKTIQTVVEFVTPVDYEAARLRLVDESSQRSSQHTVFLLGRTSQEIDDKVIEIYRCGEIVQLYRNDPDQEVKDYCTSQADRATSLTGDLQRLLKGSLAQGSFIFQGKTTPVDSLDQDVLEASKKHLFDAAAEVFNRYPEAPVRTDTTLAEKFLRAGNLKAVTSVIDPLCLVQVTGGTPHVDTDHKATSPVSTTTSTATARSRGNGLSTTSRTPRLAGHRTHSDTLLRHCWWLARSSSRFPATRSPSTGSKPLTPSARTTHSRMLV